LEVSDVTSLYQYMVVSVLRRRLVPDGTAATAVLRWEETLSGSSFT